MPDIRRHRGPHPHDAELFRSELHPVLRTAVAHLSWLLTRGYALPSSLKLVGDRFALVERQRRAVMRSACSDQSLVSRRARCVEAAELAGQHLDIDAFNLLTTIEAALSGGVLLRGRDGCIRDMASMHGSYRMVAETRRALLASGRLLSELRVAGCCWWLDQPVSNSGRLKSLITEVAEAHGWRWTATLSTDPDAPLRNSPHVVATADAAVLDECLRWCNLAGEIVRQECPDARIVDLTDGTEAMECGPLMASVR